MKHSIHGRIVAVLVAEGVNADAFYAVRKILEDGGAVIKIVASSAQDVRSTGNRLIKVDLSLQALQSNDVGHSAYSLEQPSLEKITLQQLDAVFIPDGHSVDELCSNAAALEFVAQAYKGSKVIATSGDAVNLVVAAARHYGMDVHAGNLGARVVQYAGVSGRSFFKQLLTAIAGHDQTEHQLAGELQAEEQQKETAQQRVEIPI